MQRFRCPAFIALVACITVPAYRGLAGPNIVSNGDLNHRDQEATVRESSYDGTQLTYTFEGEADFGRVVVRSKSSNDLIKYKRRLRVVYQEFGRVGTGGQRGLVIDPREVEGGSENTTITIYFNLRSKIRPGKEYEYAVLPIIPGRDENSPQPVKMVMPSVWADGELIGAEVEIPVSQAVPRETGAFVGRVTVPEFERQTGEAAFVIQYPPNFSEPLIILRVSLREVDEELAADKTPEMPVPVRYIPIEDPLEDRIFEAIRDSARRLAELQNDDGYFAAGDVNESVSVTSLIFSAFAENGRDMTDRKTLKGIEWLKRQERDERKPGGDQNRGGGQETPKITQTSAVAARLYFLARYGDVSRDQETIAGDIAWLERAQRSDGGWAELSRENEESRAMNSDHRSSAGVVTALREAFFAGKPCRPEVWYKAAQYWTESQGSNGGYRSRMDAYGGVNEAPTLMWTALGTACLMMTSDMAYAAGGRSCTQYRSNRSQIDAITNGLAFLDREYKDVVSQLQESFGAGAVGFILQRFSQGRLPPEVQVFIQAAYLQQVAAVSGWHRLNGTNHFRNEAQVLLLLYDRDNGVFAGSPFYTAMALETLASVNSPNIIQRIVAGGDEASEYMRDAEHMMRYIMQQRKRSFNWRRAAIDHAIEELVTIPICYVSFVGPFDWNQEQWRKLREYCFEGGVLIVNVADEFPGGRDAVETGLRTAFPEFELRDLPKDHPVGTLKDRVDLTGQVRVIGNGVKDFVFVTQSDWSCQWHQNQVGSPVSAPFGFINNLMAYTTDGQALKGTFDLTHYESAAQGSRSLTAEYIPVGSDGVIWPDLMASIDRSMRANYRVAVKDVSGESGQSDKPLVTWVSAGGDQPLTTSQKQKIEAAMRGDGFVFAEVVKGSESWGEALRAEIQKLDPGINIRLLPLSHPIFTGEIEGTQGFFLQSVPIRKSGQEEQPATPLPAAAIGTDPADAAAPPPPTNVGPTRGRISLHVIELDRREVGVLCEHDVSSGFSYALYPGCRGPLPRYARELAMNVMLYVMQLENTRKAGG